MVSSYVGEKKIVTVRTPPHRSSSLVISLKLLSIKYNSFTGKFDALVNYMMIYIKFGANIVLNFVAIFRFTL